MGAGPWPNAKGAYPVVVSLILEYFVICGLTSLFLGASVLVASAGLLLLQALLGSELLDRRHPSTPCFLLLWLVTALGAVAVGGRNYHASFAPYLTATSGRRYAEVPAAAAAAAYADAGVISFAEGAVVDSTRSVGLRVFGHTYCVAPIVAQDGAAAAVHFWAVGLDCCASRGRFDCDAANEEGVGARGGVVMHGAAEGEEAASRSVLAPRIFHEGYLRAVSAACSLYELQSAESPVLMRWVTNSNTVLIPWLATTLLVWLGSSVVYCALVSLVWRAASRKSSSASRTALPTADLS